jgi:hypothetical protein
MSDPPQSSPATSRCGMRPIRSGGAQEHYPGHRFALVSGPDSHHDCLRFSWSLTPDGGEPIAIGIDFATVTEDGRMRSITGFLEPARLGPLRQVHW